jgi:hypothetical protein
MLATAEQLKQRAENARAAPRFDWGVIAEWTAITQEHDTEVAAERVAYDGLTRKIANDFPELAATPDEQAEAEVELPAVPAEPPEVDITSLSKGDLLRFDFSPRLARIDAYLIGGTVEDLAQAS